MSAVPQSGVSYHAMRESDLAQVIEIEQGIYEFPWTMGNFRDSMRAGYACWMCRDGAELLGYAVLMNAAGDIHLLNLSIARRHQRRGHGRRMLLFLVDNARTARAEQMILEVRPTNAGAQNLYRDFGFREVGVRRDYYPAARGREDALVMALAL